MTTHRARRVAEAIRGVLADAIRELRDPRVGFVTLTDVELSPDLKQARVYVSTLGDAGTREAAVDALNHAGPFLRHEIAVRARLRHTPSLRFVPDPTLERGSRVEALIQELHAADGEDDDAPPEAGP